MSSTKFYKQSVFDHASISIAVLSDEDERQTSKINNKLIEYICKTFEYVTLMEPNNASDNKNSKKVYFNFKRNFSMKEKEWEHFQSHHRPFGFLFISKFKRGNDLKRLLDVYISEKEKYNMSTFESRLIFIYDENTEIISRHIRHSLLENEEMMSLYVDSETGEIISLENNFTEIDEELNLIQESFVQNEMIWYRQPLNTSLRMTVSSTNSVDESINNSPRFSIQKLGSVSSESGQPLSNSDSPLKSVENNSLTVQQSFDTEINEFLKTIVDKLFLSLMSRKNTLTNKIEQTKSKNTATSEANSDTGSVLSLDDGEFNLSDPFDQDNKKFFLEDNRFNKSNKARQNMGRLYKQTADHLLLCGNYFESYHYYQLAICYLKKSNDQLWLAGAEEGLCCSWIIFNLASSSDSFDPSRTALLHENCRILLANHSKFDSNTFLSVNNSKQSDQNDFAPFFKKLVYPDIFKNPPEIHNLNDLNEKYHSCISGYKKIIKAKFPTIYPIHLDSIIKASRFFVDQHRFLDSSNYLKMIKTDLLPIQNDLEQYHSTLGQLYAQMGFYRKSALHKYKKLLIIDSRLSVSTNSAAMKQKINEQKIVVLMEILTDLKVKISTLFNSHESGNNSWINLIHGDDLRSHSGIDQGCQSIKLELVLELFYVTKYLNYPLNTILGLGLSILDNWFMYIPVKDYERLLCEINSISKYNSNKSIRNAFVTNLPRLTNVILSKLPEYLLPKQPLSCADDENDPNSVFLYTPLKEGAYPNYRHTVPSAPIVWVCGEECEIVLKFDNPTPLPLQLADVAFLLTNMDTKDQIWISSEGSSIHYLQSNNKNIHCHFVVVPNSQNIPIGNYRITNVSYHLASILHITFHPNNQITDKVFQTTNVANIQLYPMMPQLRIMTSLNDQLKMPEFQLCKVPTGNVCSSNLVLYDNEIFEFCLFLSNESKDLDIDHLTCHLDELDLNRATNALISRFSDQMYSNRKLCNHKLLSFAPLTLEKSLPIKSLSSLKSLTITNCDNPTLPTEAILKFRIDTTNDEFCQELFHKFSLNSMKELSPLWTGQLRIKIQYRSNRVANFEFSEDLSLNCDIEDAVIIKNDIDQPNAAAYRESVCLVNCQLMSGLGLINYHLDSSLNLELSLMNFTNHKMNVEIFWKNIKIHKNYIVIASECEKSEKIDKLSEVRQSIHRNSSTELFPQIYSMSIPEEKLQLKSLMRGGSMNTHVDLAKYIQSNLQISWFMKDKSLDKIRQGNVNLSWCNCCFSRTFCQEVLITNVLLTGHELSFSVFDIVRIWMWDNVNLEMMISSDTEVVNESPSLPDNRSETINVYEGIAYQMICKFKDPWPSFVSLETISSIRLLPCVVTNKVSINGSSNSSSEFNNKKLERFVFSGNTVLYLTNDPIDETEASGYLMFLSPGSYSISCQLTVCNSDFHNWQSNVIILAESNIHLIYVN